jgi:hypothetical protein
MSLPIKNIDVNHSINSFYKSIACLHSEVKQAERRLRHGAKRISEKRMDHDKNVAGDFEGT